MKKNKKKKKNKFKKIKTVSLTGVVELGPQPLCPVLRLSQQLHGQSQQLRGQSQRGPASQASGSCGLSVRTTTPLPSETQKRGPSGKVGSFQLCLRAGGTARSFRVVLQLGKQPGSSEPASGERRAGSIQPTFFCHAEACLKVK